MMRVILVSVLFALIFFAGESSARRKAKAKKCPRDPLFMETELGLKKVDDISWNENKILDPSKAKPEGSEVTRISGELEEGTRVREGIYIIEYKIRPPSNTREDYKNGRCTVNITVEAPKCMLERSEMYMDEIMDGAKDVELEDGFYLYSSEEPVVMRTCNEDEDFYSVSGVNSVQLYCERVGDAMANVIRDAAWTHMGQDLMCEYCPRSQGYVMCNNTGECIKDRKLCNGRANCADGEDEVHCEDSTFFQCNDGSIIPNIWLCDAWNDCNGAEWEDEQCHLCRDRNNELIHAESCGEGDPRCLLPEWICDGIADCEDGSDESSARCDMYCPAGEFRCNDRSMCLPMEQLCDHIEQCYDGSDEDRCGIMKEIGEETVPMWMHHVSTADEPMYVPVCAEGWTDAQSDDACQYMGFGSGSSHGVMALSQLGGEGMYGFVMMDRVMAMSEEGEEHSQWSRHFVDECPNNEILTLTCGFDAMCGARAPVHSGNYERIVNGQNATTGAWPWQVALLHGGDFTCGGTLVSDCMVVTAAHCVGDNPIEYSVMIGSTVLGGGDIVQVADIIIHSTYDDSSLKNDIAVLQLAGPLEFSDTVRPVCLPDSDHMFTGPDAMECYTTGWGYIDPWRLIHRPYLQQARMYLIEDEVCASNPDIARYGLNENRMLCAGYEHGYTTVCNGDSGGPLVCRGKDNIWTLAGVVSWGPVDASTHPPTYCMGISVYTEVAALANWLENRFEDFGECNAAAPTVEPVECDDDEFTCANRQRCIPTNWICDGDNDCGDFSDERACEECPGMVCDEDKCVGHRYICDGHEACEDGADEEQEMCDARTTPPPGQCYDYEFTCGHGEDCIWSTWVCDGDNDCGDFSDERDCENCMGVECDGNKCVGTRYLCDGEDHCDDGMDESEEICAGRTTPEPSACFECENGAGCIPNTWICDGDNDCGDFSDERRCDYCAGIECDEDVKCVGLGYICDDEDHCEDGSDETRAVCREYTFECSNGETIPNYWLCDGWNDCETDSWEDEQCDLCVGRDNMPLGTDTCGGEDRRCLLQEWICDGIEDCEDGSDEAYDRCEHHCPGDYFLCNNRDCVDSATVCDGHADCGDGSDEHNCAHLSEDRVVMWLHVDATMNMGPQYMPMCFPSVVDESFFDHVCQTMGFSGHSMGEAAVISNIDLTYGVVMVTPASGDPARLTIQRAYECPRTEYLMVTCEHPYDTCGVRLPENFDDHLARVIHGTTAEEGEWPWQVALEDRDGGFFCGGSIISDRHMLTGMDYLDWTFACGFFCGGSIISDRHVLTAAHCVEGQNPGSLRVRVGTNNLTMGNRKRVEAYAIHPGWDSGTILNDMAIVELRNPLDLSGRLMRKICLPDIQDSQMFLNRMNILECYVTGWGGVDPWAITFQNGLQEGRVFLIGDDACANDGEISSTNLFQPDEMLCAGYEHGYVTVCNGDSGGPLVCKNKNNVWTQAGVVSWGPIDGTTRPSTSCLGIGVFAQVTHYIDWINDIIGEPVPIA